MKKVLVPLALLGVGGVGVLVLSERAREAVREMLGRLQGAPDQLADWSERAQQEIDRIEQALNRVAETLETAR